MLFTHSPKRAVRIHCLSQRLSQRLSRAIAVLLLSATAAHTEIQHVIAISVDGLRGDLLQGFLSVSPAEFPNFVRLREAGASTFNARCDYDYSETVPNHITMLTGRPVIQAAGLPGTWHHGFFSNFPTTSPFIKIPLDHCLTSPLIGVKAIRTGPHVGSDHLPIIADLLIPRVGETALVP